MNLVQQLFTAMERGEVFKCRVEHIKANTLKSYISVGNKLYNTKYTLTDIENNDTYIVSKVQTTKRSGMYVPGELKPLIELYVKATKGKAITGDEYAEAYASAMQALNVIYAAVPSDDNFEDIDDDYTPSDEVI